MKNKKVKIEIRKLKKNDKVSIKLYSIRSESEFCYTPANK